MRIFRQLLPVFITLFAFSAHARLIDIVTYNGPAQQLLQMVASTPAANSQLSQQPKKIMVTFTENILLEKSKLKLFDQYNTLVNTIPVITQSATNTLAVDVPGKLLSGTYRVDWEVQCLCPNATTVNNTFYFSIY